MECGSAVESPMVYRYQEDSDFKRGETVLQFRLLYSGRLLGASKNDTRASLKHQIRREFSPQLKRLWDTNQRLVFITHDNGRYWLEKHPDERLKGAMPDGEVRALLHDSGLKHLAQTWERSGQKCVPLVTENMGVRCTLEILFLRPEEPGMLVKGGDLDNRIKTLFDALRLPKSLDEMNGEIQDEPIYCLFEDDRLISEFRIVADHLLLLPRETEANPNDVFLVVDVKLEVRAGSRWQYAFA